MLHAWYINLGACCGTGCWTYNCTKAICSGVAPCSISWSIRSTSDSEQFDPSCPWNFCIGDFLRDAISNLCSVRKDGNEGLRRFASLQMSGGKILQSFLWIRRGSGLAPILGCPFSILPRGSLDHGHDNWNFGIHCSFPPHLGHWHVELRWCPQGLRLSVSCRHRCGWHQWGIVDMQISNRPMEHMGPICPIISPRLSPFRCWSWFFVLKPSLPWLLTPRNGRNASFFTPKD